MGPSGTKARWVLVTFAVAVATVVAACGGGNGNNGNNGPSNVSKYSPVKGTNGGTLTYSDWESVSDLNVLSSSAQTTQQATSVIWAQLWQFGPDNKPIPDLVSEIPSTDNGDVKQIDSNHMDMTVKLKGGLKWSDGSALTTADVQKTWMAICDPLTGVASQVGYDHISSMEIKSDTEMVWHFGPDPTEKRCGGAMKAADSGIYAPYLLLTFPPIPDAVMGKIPHAQWATSDYFTKLPTPTSGPYKVQSFTPGAAAVVTMVPNEHYADGRSGAQFFNHKAYLDKLTYKIYGDKQGQIAGLGSGDTDLGLDLIANDFKTLPGTNDNKYATGGLDEYLNFNAGNNTTGCAPTFAATCGTPTVFKDDPQLRQAISMSIDRDTMVTALVAGIGKSFDGAILPGYDFYNSSLNPTPKFDIDGAKKLLDQDGWAAGSDGKRTKGGKPLTFTISTTSGNKQRASEAEQLIANWAKIGATATLKTFPAGDFFNDFKSGGTNATGQFDVSLYANTWGPNDPDTFCSTLTSDQTPSAANPSGGNWDRTNNPKFDTDCKTGRATIKPTERQAAYDDLQKEYHSYQPWAILYLRPDVFSVSKSFGNFLPEINLCLAVCNAVDWFKKS